MDLSLRPRSIAPAMARITAPARVTEALAWLDQAELAVCRRFNRAVRSAGFTRVFQVASRLGDGVLWYTLIAVLAVSYGQAGRLIALQCAVAGITGLAIYRALKNVLVRERPYITHEAIVLAGKPLDRFSFPSGHTLHAVSFTLIVTDGLPLLALVLVPIALVIAASRVVLGLHYPSDVAAGGLIGALVASLTLSLIGA
jgi:undecaprenyl-diphosphatase